jgi:formamidopyrimidine-DNA glycosylase
VPELPEVEITARGLRSFLVGATVLAAGEVDWPRMLPNSTAEEIEAALPGQAVAAVERRGKYLILRFSSGGALVIHRKMSGNLVLRPSDSPRERHTHLVVAFDNGWELHFVDPRKFGRIYYFRSQSDLDDFITVRLGLEPLDGLTPGRLLKLLAGRRRRLKPLLVDQGFLAGVGNVYADEALWLARLHPERLAHTLTRAEVRRLGTAIQDVLENAIERRGTSFSSYVDAAGEPGENQIYLLAYGRAGQPCPRCGTPIERRLIAQRGTWFCPRCQRLPQGRRALHPGR